MIIIMTMQVIAVVEFLEGASRKRNLKHQHAPLNFQHLHAVCAKAI